jgi:hypothetical protein
MFVATARGGSPPRRAAVNFPHSTTRVVSVSATLKIAGRMMKCREHITSGPTPSQAIFYLVENETGRF